MGKKKHAEEHVNLERWLVSYADFITLLFATFVVLYALAQIDSSELSKLEESIKKAFAAPSLIQGSDSLLLSQGSSILDSSILDNQAVIPPILENISQKYEEESFKEIKKAMDELKKEGQLQGVDSSIMDRGLVINLKDMNLFFKSASAQLNPDSHKTLKEVGSLIRSKFATHLIRVEGYTDNLPIDSSLYPSNWELSSARASSIVRFLLENFKFKKDKFAALGYADTKAIAPNNTEEGRQKNRRVEIVVLRNKYLKSEAAPEFKENETAKIAEQPKSYENDSSSVSDAAKKLAKEAGYSPSQVIILKDSADNKAVQARNDLEKFEQDRNRKKQALQQAIKPPQLSTANHEQRSDDKKHEMQVINYQSQKVNDEKNILKSIMNNMDSNAEIITGQKQK
ncbi:MAG: OmpA family protein [Candidatus Gastranaerophilaceae bacterium]|jgi:chemotaxis protein MotB